MDSLNVDELFADLKRVVAEEKQSDEPTKGDVDGFHDDKLSVEIDDKTEQFQAIERNLKRLPKLQTGFDQLGTNGKQIQVEEQSKHTEQVKIIL